jgi:hypothetical protein
MALTSLNYSPPPPEPLGPLQPGYRRIMFTSAYNMAALQADLNEVRDVPTEEAERYVANNMAIMFDDLPPEPEPEVVVLEMPKPYAPKPDWVAYALSVDPELAQDHAENMTKSQLQNKYGERL